MTGLSKMLPDVLDTNNSTMATFLKKFIKESKRAY